MLLPPAGAAESLFYLQSGLDLCAPFAAIRAHEMGLRTSPFVIVQALPRELLVSALPAFDARVRLHIARAEPASCACETDRFPIVLFCVVEDVLVEHVSLQHVVASVAAPSFSPPLALDAVFRIRFEAFGDLLNTARGACVARYTTQCPIAQLLSRVMPLTVTKFVLAETLAAY